MRLVSGACSLGEVISGLREKEKLLVLSSDLPPVLSQMESHKLLEGGG